MAFYQNTAEGGSNGVAVTNLNSGGESGNNFNQVTITGSGSVVFANNVSANGSMSYRISGGASSTAKVYLGSTSTATNEGALRSYFYLNAVPSGGAPTIFQIQSTAFATMVNLRMDLSGRFQLRSASDATLFTAAVPLAIQTWYRVELQAIAGQDATNGTVRFQYFEGDSLTPVEQFESLAANTGTDNALRLHVGKHDSTTVFDANFDNLAYQNSATVIGPYVENTNSAPLANAGSDQVNVEPYTTVTLSGSASSDPDGTIAAYDWVQTTGSPIVTLSGNGATRAFSAPGTIAGATLTFGLTVTDNDGEESTQDTVNVTILPVTERAVVGGQEVPAQLLSVKS